MSTIKTSFSQKIRLQKEELEEYKWFLPEEIKNYLKYPDKIINTIIKEIKKL
ncbi:MAG: hypothetical protein P8X70_02565 [Nanoarchaeota archaeon]